MSEFADFLQDFSDFPKVGAALYEVGGSLDADSVDTESYTLIATGEVFLIVSSSIQTNNNDQFVNQEVGDIMFNFDMMDIESGESFNFDKDFVIVINSNNYYIEGKEDVQNLNDYYVFSYRREIV